MCEMPSNTTAFTDIKHSLRKLDFPLCVRESLKTIEKLCLGTHALGRTQSLKQTDFAMALISEFVFCEADRRTSKKRKLSALQELLLLEVLCDYLSNRNISEVWRNSIFMSLFPSSHGERSRLLVKLVSLSISINNSSVLSAAAVLIQQVGCTSKFSIQLAQGLVNDHFVLTPKDTGCFQELPVIAPLFTANFLTAVAEMYYSSDKGVMIPPPLRLLEVITQWVTECPSLCITALIVNLQPALPLGGIPMPAVTPYAEMPQLKAPESLYHIGLRATRQWILSVAIDLSKQYGNYENVKCQEIITEVNKYLITNVAARVIDELYNSSDIFIGVIRKSSVIHEQNLLYKKIVISMYINKNMKTLTCHKIVNDNFWKVNLNSLANLVKLDLNKVCTDEILEVVGKTCRLLEIINISSKLSPFRTKHRHNALKLQLCVSDIGLEYLLYCKELKEIEMTCIIRNGCGGCKVTNDGIRRLLIHLPKLRRINYTDTGTLLDSVSTFNQKLSLISVIDYHPSAARIPQIEYLCPFLTELHLTYAFSSFDFRSEIISALTSSQLKISSLSLNNFSFDEDLKRYFEVKGSHLKVFRSLYAFTKSEETSKNFILLGRLCPNLETLHMEQYMQSFYEGTYDSFSPQKVDKNINLFCNLRKLVVKMVSWDSCNLIPILLKDALLIKTVVLSNHSSPCSLDKPLKFIQKTNTFDYLESLHFLYGFSLPYDFLATFITECRVLKHLSILCHTAEYVELVHQMCNELSSKNVDINIVCKITL